MSKTIIIQKNGVAQTLTVDKLRLPKHGGGTEDWLPADGKNLVKIVVKQNGTYKASDFGAYGISEVKVACTLSGGSATSAVATKAVKALHNPCPAEGGLARVMSAHHLETLLSTTGSCQWVPEAEVSLGTKYINVDNKTYKAADDGKYGYSQVTVSGISITKDGDTITHTDGTGTTTYTLPDHIRVEHPPLKISYVDGEPIDYYYLLVKAYNADGTIWTDENHPGGVIPLEELILPETVADISKITGDVKKECSDFGEGSWPQPVTATRGFLENNADPHTTIEYDGYIAMLLTDYDYAMEWMCCTDRPGTVAHINPGTGQWPADVAIDATYTHDGKTVYYGINWSGLVLGSLSGGVNYYVDGNELNKAQAAWTLLYGTTVQTIGQQILPVKWARPWDYEVLEDSFGIFVKDSQFGGAEGGGGQTSGGGAGRDN